MTWGDATSSTTPSWTSSGSTVLTFTSPSDASALGNFNRMVDADPLLDATGGVDFANTFSSENPWVFTLAQLPISFRSSDRNDPA